MATARSTRPARRATTDRALLREFLERDRLLAAYAICDLEDREFGRTRWGIATPGDEVVAIGLEYGGLTPQPMFLMGDTDGIAAILRDVVRPGRRTSPRGEGRCRRSRQHYHIEPGRR